MRDEDLPGFAARLGLPGLFDVHTHFMPKSVMDKVWAYFDAAGPMTGRSWPIEYRWPEERRLEHLRGMGIRHFSALSYAHKPDMAEFLNAWGVEFAADKPDCLWSGTFYPEAGVDDYVRDLIDGGVEVFKLHVQVGNFSAADPLLDKVWGMVADSGTPVVLHAGSGPVAGKHTGPADIATVLERHPSLVLLIAHMGAPEAEEFLALAETYDNVGLDTTMIFTDFFDDIAPYPRDLLPRVRDVSHKVYLGTDFPNIPHPYAHQVESLVRLDLGDEWLRAVMWHNAARLFKKETRPSGVTAV